MWKGRLIRYVSEYVSEHSHKGDAAELQIVEVSMVWCCKQKKRCPHIHHPALLLTMQWRPWGAAGHARYGTAAAAHAASSTQNAAASSHASSSSSTNSSCPVQLLLDLLQAGAFLEARHPVHHPRGHVGAGTGCATIRVDWKHVAGASKGADGYPATVLTKAHVLNLSRQTQCRNRTERKKGQREETTDWSQ